MDQRTLPLGMWTLTREATDQQIQTERLKSW